MVKLIAVKMTHFNMTYRNGSFMSLGIENKLWLTRKKSCSALFYVSFHIFFWLCSFILHSRICEFVIFLLLLRQSYWHNIYILLLLLLLWLIQHLETKCNILFLFFFLLWTYEFCSIESLVFWVGCGKIKYSLFRIKCPIFLRNHIK